MNDTQIDVRARDLQWDAGQPGRWYRARMRLLVLLMVPLVLFYFGWLLQPERIGHPALYALLISAELFNATQAIGFWWTCLGRVRPLERLRLKGSDPLPAVDVLIPVYDEPVEIVELTVVAAAQMRGARLRVALLDDGKSDAMREMAERHEVAYLTRPDNEGAKAGNINHALGHTDAPYVLVLDCDHVPQGDFLEETLPHLTDPDVAFVQTPQYYANLREGDIAGAAWSQQSLFFGPIARGKDGHDSMFCCGTNVVFSRDALESIGGFPQESVTEDFELSVKLHEQGWRTVYVPRVLARGLGPEDMASYVSQQQRWARGCLSAIPAVLRARLPLRQRIQYLLSASFFLTGWTLLVYMSFPIVRILTGEQPLAATAADQFLLHFAPYFGFALLAVALAGAGSYTFKAFALQSVSFWIHVHATLTTLLRRRARFVVTPKQGARERQVRTVLPGLLMASILIGVSVYGLVQRHDPSTLNNVAFAALHVTVLLSGAAPALRRAPARQQDVERAVEVRTFERMEVAA